MVDTEMSGIVGSSSVDEASLSPWDRMTLAKAALLATEEQEAETRRQKRGETREDSLPMSSADDASRRSSIMSVVRHPRLSPPDMTDIAGFHFNTVRPPKQTHPSFHPASYIPQCLSHRFFILHVARLVHFVAATRLQEIFGQWRLGERIWRT